MMEWSEMLPEVLETIALKHIAFYEDYLSFAGVCKSWRLAAAARTYDHNSNGPPSRLPSLMLAEKSDDLESCELFLFSNKSIRKIRLPEAYGKQYCRSSCGWLLTVGEDFAFNLINPLSCEIINLPKGPERIHPSYMYCPIQKAVLLMESKSVFVMWDDDTLGFCHIGDNKWKCVEQNMPICDITYYHGHIYSFDGCTIQAWNVNGKDPAVMVDVAMTPEDAVMTLNYDYYSAYIVGLDDGERKQLLVIIQKGINYTRSFQVLAYDLQSQNWSKVKDFGTKTLFVGYCNSSFWVEDTTGMIKGNCIYYPNGMDGDIGIYHLLDGTIEPYSAAESLWQVRPPIWLQSM